MRDGLVGALTGALTGALGGLTAVLCGLAFDAWHRPPFPLPGGPEMTATLPALSSDAGIDVTSFPPRGDDDAPRFAAAAAHCPPVSCVLLVPANARLRLGSPIVIAANRTLAILGAGHGTSRLEVDHAGTALTVTQNSTCHTTTISGLRIQAGIAAGRPVAGGIAIDYRGATPCAAQPQSVGMDDDEILAAEDAHAMLAPHPGTFVNGITLLGPQPAMLGLLRLSRINIEPTLTAAPSLPGTSGLALSLVDDIQISDSSVSYAQTAILQTDYLEGLRLSGISTGGTDHFLMQGPHITRQNSIYLQKMWLQDFEIDTYKTAFPVALISNSFLGNGEIIRYGNSGADNWAGIDCTDCFGWMGASNLYFDGLVGNPAGAVGMRFRARERSDAGYHSFIGTRFARLGTSVALEQGVRDSQFLLMQSQDNTGRIVAAYADRSGNASNLLTYSDGQATVTLRGGIVR